MSGGVRVAVACQNTLRVLHQVLALVSGLSTGLQNYRHVDGLQNYRHVLGAEDYLAGYLNSN